MNSDNIAFEDLTDFEYCQQHLFPTLALWPVDGNEVETNLEINLLSTQKADATSSSDPDHPKSRTFNAARHAELSYLFDQSDAMLEVEPYISAVHRAYSIGRDLSNKGTKVINSNRLTMSVQTSDAFDIALELFNIVNFSTEKLRSHEKALQ